MSNESNPNPQPAQGQETVPEQKPLPPRLALVGVAVVLLLAAILFHFTVFRRISEATPPASGTRRWMVAFVSLGLWLGVALAGKMVGIYGDDLRQEDDPFHTQKQASARSPIWNRATR